MKKATKDRILEALRYCYNEDKSTEFTIQYVQDFANVSLDCVMKFLKDTNQERNTESYGGEAGHLEGL